MEKVSFYHNIVWRHPLLFLFPGNPYRIFKNANHIADCISESELLIQFLVALSQKKEKEKPSFIHVLLIVWKTCCVVLENSSQSLTFSNAVKCSHTPS